MSLSSLSGNDVLISFICLQTVKELFKLINKKLFVGVVSLHVGGFALGYIISKLGRGGERKSRAISIETGKCLQYCIPYVFIILLIAVQDLFYLNVVSIFICM